MTFFDFAFLGILLLSLLLGAWRGLVSELFALAGWTVAVILAWKLAGSLAQHLPVLTGNLPLQWVVAFVVIVVAILLFLALVRFALRELIAAMGLSVTDRMAGAVFGIARGMLIALVLVGLGGLTSLPREAWWKEAVFAPPLETVVIALKSHMPKDLAARIRYR